MLANTNLLVVFPEQLTTNDVAILCDNAHEAIHVFGVLADQL